MTFKPIKTLIRIFFSSFLSLHRIHTWKIKNHKEHYYTSFRLRNKSTNPYTHKPLPIYMNKIEFYGYVETFKVVSNSIICRYLEN